MISTIILLYHLPPPPYIQVLCIYSCYMISEHYIIFIQIYSRHCRMSAEENYTINHRHTNNMFCCYGHNVNRHLILQEKKTDYIGLHIHIFVELKNGCHFVDKKHWLTKRTNNGIFNSTSQSNHIRNQKHLMFYHIFYSFFLYRSQHYHQPNTGTEPAMRCGEINRYCRD